MSTPEEIKAAALADVNKAKNWLTQWYYQFGIGVLVGALGHAILVHKLF